MGLLKRLSMRNKLIMMLLLPLAMALYFSAFALIESWNQNRALERIQLLAEVAVDASSLVHELQKERGLTAGFLGSKGEKLGSELAQQRRTADQRLETYQQRVAGLDKTALWPAFNQQLELIAERIAALPKLRQRVSDQSIPLKEALGQYTGGNADLLQIVSLMALQTDDIELANRANAYYYFLQGKSAPGSSGRC